MKRLAAAVLGLALSVSLAPAAQAQSLNFGSLGSSETNTPEPLPTGVPFTLFEWGHYTLIDNWHRCEVGIHLNQMVEHDGPAVGNGYVGAVDTATGREFISDLDNRYSTEVMVFNYIDDTQADWLGTTRDFEVFVMDFFTNERREIGTLTAAIPSACSTGEGRVELATGYVRP